MSDVRSEGRRKAGVMILAEPNREDIKLLVAGEHGVEGGKIAERLLHHLGPGIDEGAVNGGIERGAARRCWRRAAGAA